MKKILYCLLLLPFSLYGSELPKANPAYSDMLLGFNELVGGRPQLASIVEYGRSIENRPLVAIRLGEKEYIGNPHRPAMLVTGVTHGHEYINVVDQLPAWALSVKNPLAQFFANGGIFYIVPVFNPDGYAIADRYNKNKVDLNRDFTVIPNQDVKFTQPETTLFAKYLDGDLKKHKASLKYAVSYHCCGRGETGNGWGDTAELGYPWGYTKKSLSETELARHKESAELIKQAFDNTFIQVGAWSKILYSVQGVATDYYYAKYGALSFVFEGKENYEAQRIEDHFAMWIALAEKAIEKRN